MSENIALAALSVKSIADLGVSPNRPSGSLGIPTRAFVDNWRKLVQLGYCVAPVNLFDKNPGYPGPLATEGFLRRQADRGYTPPAGSWLNGPYFFGLKWSAITLENLQEGGEFRGDYERYMRKPSAEFAGIGIIHNGHLIAIDVDAEDPTTVAKAREILDALPGPICEIVGRRGFKRYYWVAEGGVKKAAFKSAAGFGIDILGDGSFSVIAPSFHIGAGRRYESTGDIHLQDTPPNKLQALSAAQIKAFVAAMIPQGEQAGPPRSERSEWVRDGESFADELNENALRSLDLWVPALFGGDARKSGATYRARRVWDGFEGFNISISSSGIFDHGAAQEGFTAVRLVERVLQCSWLEASEWLGERLGVSFGDWRADQAAACLADMPACTVRVGKWLLDIPAGGIGETVLREAPVETQAEESADFDFQAANRETLRAAEEVRSWLEGFAACAVAENGQSRSEAHRVIEKMKAAGKTIEGIDRNLKDHSGYIRRLEKQEAALLAAGADDEEIGLVRDRARERKSLAANEEMERAAIVRSRRYDRQNLTDIKPSVVSFEPYQGLGKTSSLARHALPVMTAGGNVVLSLSATLDQAREQAQMFSDATSGEIPHAIIYGMDAIYPQTDEEKSSGAKPRQMCHRHKEVKAISAAGLNSSELCQSDGHVCEFAGICPIYQARLKVADSKVVFGSSANLFVNQQSLSDFHPDTLIIDESFTHYGRPDAIEINFEDLLSFENPLKPADFEQKEPAPVEGMSVDERLDGEAAIDKFNAAKAAHGRRLALWEKRCRWFDDAREAIQIIKAVQVEAKAAREAQKDMLPVEQKDDRHRHVVPLSIPDDINIERLMRVLRWSAGYQLKTRVRGLISPRMSDKEVSKAAAGGAGRVAVLARARVALANEILRYVRTGAAVGYRVLVVNDDTLRILPSNPINDRYLKPSPDMVERILIMNGTPEARHLIKESLTYQGRLQAFGPASINVVETTRPPLAESVKVIQITGQQLTSSSKMGWFHRTKNPSAKRKNGGAQNRRDAAALLNGLVQDFAGGDPRKVVVVGSEHIRSFCAEVMPAGVEFLERGKAVGVDKYKDHRLLIYIDAGRPPYAEREQIMRELDIWVQPEDFVLGEDGSYRLGNSIWEAHRRASQVSLVQQGVERLRTRWAKPVAQQVVVLSNLDGILPSGEAVVMDWSDVRTDVKSQARTAQLRNELDRLMFGKLFSKNRKLMTAVWGRDFSDEELREMFALIELGTFDDNKTAEVLHSNLIGPERSQSTGMSPVRFRALTKNRRNWSEAYSYRSDIKDLIIAAFNGEVEFDDVASKEQVELQMADDRGDAQLSPVFTAPAMAMAAAPNAWPSIEAAKKDLQRNPPIRPEGWETVMVTLEGRGQRAGAVYVPPGLAKIEVINLVEAATGRKVKSVSAAGAGSGPQ